MGSLLGESIPQHKKYLNCKCSLFSSSVSPSVATVNIGTNIIQSHIFIRTSRFGLKRKCILDCQYLWIYIFVEFFWDAHMRKNKKISHKHRQNLGKYIRYMGKIAHNFFFYLKPETKLCTRIKEIFSFFSLKKIGKCIL